MKYLNLFIVLLLFNTTTVIAQDIWEIIDTPADTWIRSIDVNSEGVIYIGLHYEPIGGVLKYDNDSSSWIPVGIQNKGVHTLVIPPDDFIHAGSDTIYLSTDNGGSWEIISPYISSRSYFVCNDYRLFAGTGAAIYKSDTLDSDWIKVLSVPNTEVITSILEDTLTGMVYAGSTNFMGGGGIYRSEDGGDTWEHFALTDHYVSCLAMNSSGDLFAGTSGHHTQGTGGVYMLPHGQQEWTNVNNEELVISMAINSEDKIFIGCSSLDYLNGGVRCSDDNGQTWENISYDSMPYEDIEELALGPDEHLYAVSRRPGQYYRLYKTINTTITSITMDNTEREIITYNYPNPFTNQTILHFCLPQIKTNEITITIYNPKGQLIKSYEVSIGHNYNNSFRFDASDLPAGVYYYKLSTESFYSCNKMVVQR